MSLTFTKNGYLSPPKEIPTNENELKESLVESIAGSKTRKLLFENYLDFVAEFSGQITSNFTVWIDGSFATLKPNPNDIDLVIFLEEAIFQKKQKELEVLKSKYTLKNLDLYVVEVYSIGHKKYTWYQSDKAYWRDWFSKTRPNRRTRKAISKGFLSIIYNEQLT